MRYKHFIVLISILLGILAACIYLQSCTDGGIKPDVKTVDTLTNKPPQETDTTKAIYHINKIFQDAPQNFLINGEGITVKEGDNLQAIIDAVPVDGRVTLFLPKGEFPSVTIYNKSIWLIGSNGTLFKGDIIINRDHYVHPCRLANLEVKGSVKVSSITSLENVTVKNAPGNGFEFIADIVSNKQDISHSFVSNCEAIQCGGDGFLFRGGDANAITVLNCSARDNKGWGFNDQSFLGNYFFGAMGHANDKGHYKSGDKDNNANVRTVWAACYGEGGSPKSYAAGASKIFGGIHADGWELHNWATADYK